jgi:hypothetical protein
LSLKGNKHFHDYHPSNPNGNNTVGSYLVDNWSNIIFKRYQNYLNTYGLKFCISQEYIDKNSKPKSNLNTNPNPNTNTANTNNTDTNTNTEDQPSQNIKEDDNSIHLTESKIENIEIIENIEKIEPVNNMICDFKINEINYSINNIQKSLNDLNLINNQQKFVELCTNFTNPTNTDKDINYFNNIQSIIYNTTFYKYQEEILSLKKFIYYILCKKGSIENDIFNEFSEDFIKNTLGSQYNYFIKQ